MPQNATAPPDLAAGLTGEAFLGTHRAAGTQPAVRGRDPRGGTLLEPPYRTSTPDQIDDAAVLAGAAATVLRRTTGAHRATFLRAIATRLEQVSDLLLLRSAAETGLPAAALAGELARTTGQLRMFADLVDTDAQLEVCVEPAQPERQPLPRPELRRLNVPLGPVAVFGASNFPLAFSVAGGDTAAALAAGCPVVVKAHPSHPGTSEIVAGAIASVAAELGLPEGTFSLVYGGPETGQQLATHPAIRAVAFTGSRTGGLALLAAVASRPVPIPVYAEMSSVNPVFLLPGAITARARSTGDQFVQSLTTRAGQLCTNPGLVFAVQAPGLDDFLDAVARATAATPAAPMLSETIRDGYEHGVQALRTHPATTELATGRADAALAVGATASVFTTDAEAWLRHPSLAEEVFGAAALIVVVPNAADLPAIARRLEGQLTATVQVGPGDDALALELLPLLEEKAGRIVLNGWPTGVEVGPATVHGGPFPATSDGCSTSVGLLAINRFLRPLAYQNAPQHLLPAALRE